MHKDSTLARRYLWAAVLVVPLFSAPVVLGVWSLATSAAMGDEGIEPGMAVPLLALLGLCVFAWRKRFRPGRWSGPASVAGLVTAMLLALTVAGTLPETPAFVTPLLVVAGIVLFALVANWAQRILTSPLVPELAASPLEIPVRGRASKKTTIHIGVDRLSVNLGRVRNRGRRHVFEPSMPLADVTSVDRVELRDGEAIVPGEWTDLPTAVRGPGVRVGFGDVQWSLPTDDADMTAELVRHRVARRHSTSAPA